MLRFVKLSCSLLFLAELTLAQFGSAIQGTVMDGTSAVMPGVRVLVTNLDTGVAREAISSELGLYRVPSLSSGTYKITATNPALSPVHHHSLLPSLHQLRTAHF